MEESYVFGGEWVNAAPLEEGEVSVSDPCEEEGACPFADPTSWVRKTHHEATVFNDLQEMETRDLQWDKN